MKIYVAIVEVLRRKKKGGLKFKIGGNISLVPSFFFFVKFIPNYAFDALLCQNWLSLPLIT
jgi:hypothetical protein